MKKWVYIVLGWFFVALGAIGLFLPILPTTPFLLLASWLFLRSSPVAERWLLSHKTFGPMVRNFQIHKAIPRKTKVIVLLMMWGSILASVFFFVSILWVKILLIVIAILVSIHILHFKTLRDSDRI